MPIRDWLLGLFDRKPRVKVTAGVVRGPAIHVVILDGTMSSLKPGCETNAGRAYKLLRELGVRAGLTVYYEAGIQWRDWGSTLDVMLGRGINRQIERAYGVLASRWKPGDRIVLIGYSRGAYAVRSLGGVLGELGLLKTEFATERYVRQAYRHYQANSETQAAKDFRRAYCHTDVEVEAVAVWDTVKALGLRIPIVWRWAEDQHGFHNHQLGAHVRNGFHALALNETREAYAPVMWRSDEGWSGHIEQVWFRGCHGDTGGQIGGRPEARPLANFPLIWMLDRLAACNVPLPDDWRQRFPTNENAPSIGNWGGWSWLFLSRRRRIVGADPSEALHSSVPERMRKKLKEPVPVVPMAEAAV